MQLRQEKIRINRKEMREIKRMDHAQMEQRLTEAMRLGYTASEAERDLEIALAVEETGRRWHQALQKAVKALRGIGEKRKELLMEYVKIELEKEGICRK